MRWYGIDLHIHTVLSPCGDFSMSPKAIVERAKMLNIDIIAITDHHIVENYPAVRYWGEKMGVIVLPGIEIQTKEEVHIVGIFKDYLSALEFQKKIWTYLPNLRNDENLFGIQVVVNENEEVERIEERLLSVSLSLSIEEVIDLIREKNGISILAHLDRPSYSIISNLGFIPETLKYDILELSKRGEPEKFITDFPSLKDKPLIISSDAHFINDMIMPKTFLGLDSFSWENFLRSLKSKKIRYQMEV
ncbi:MAG: PHP domain-containing protein [Dictyoglomaceae bacterium]